MTSIRRQLEAALIERLPETWDIRADVDTVDGLEPETPILLILTNRLTPGPARGLRTHEFVLRLIAPTTDPDVVDDVLDELLDELLDVLPGLDPLSWQAATRTEVANAFAAYDVTVTLPARKDTTNG